MDELSGCANSVQVILSRALAESVRRIVHSCFLTGRNTSTSRPQELLMPWRWRPSLQVWPTPGCVRGGAGESPARVVYFDSPPVLWPERAEQCVACSWPGVGVTVAGHRTALRIRVRRHADQVVDRGGLFLGRCCNLLVLCGDHGEAG